MQLVQRICLIGLLSVSYLASVSAQNRIEAKNLSDYETAMRAIVDLKMADLLGDVNSANWVLLATVRPPFEKNELFVGLARFSSGLARLVVLSPYPVSVYRQIQTLRSIDFADVKNISKIKLSSMVVDSKECQQLSQLVTKWENYSFPIVPKNELMLDATGYDLEFRSKYGGKLETVLEGGSLKDDTSPIIRLLGETYKACETN